MKTILHLFAFLFCLNLYGQSLTLFHTDPSKFPLISAKFYALDKDGIMLPNLSPADFSVSENGQVRSVLSVVCPPPSPSVPISSVLTIDVSGSMKGGNLAMAKAAANAWVEALDMDNSECAITTFSDASYLNQDFTTDKDILLNAINLINLGAGTSFNAGFLDPPGGALFVGLRGQKKKVIVFLTDGRSAADEISILNQANLISATIYCVILNGNCPQVLKNISLNTGGQWFDNVSSLQEAEDIYRVILKLAQDNGNCTLEWQSDFVCDPYPIKVEAKIPQNGSFATANYLPPDKAIAKLIFDPVNAKFINPTPGIKIDQLIKVTALNSDFNVINISNTNPSFLINPSSFQLNAGQSINLTVSYIPADSGYNIGKFEFEAEPCLTKFYAIGGWIGKRVKQKTLNLIHPNGGQVFVVGMDTIITWEGILPEDTVKIEYTIDNGNNWILLSDTATGLSYKWIVPKTPSNNCLARVTTKSVYEGCQEVMICDQIWMGCNLDVEFYRNGDSIRQAQTAEEWRDAIYHKEGAWCYYDNDEQNGTLYGKLYNWYAVTDPRGIAPEGWHIPSDQEWMDLETCLGIEQRNLDKLDWRGDDEGGKLKAKGTLEDGDGLWISPNQGATNSTGFTALPAGYRKDDYYFYDIKFYTGFWASDGNGWDNLYRGLLFDRASIYRFSRTSTYGFSVRCLRDE